MKPSESESLQQVFEAFISVEVDIDRIRACRDTFTRKAHPARAVALAHAMEMACVEACIDSLAAPDSAPARLEEAVRSVWAEREAKRWVFRAAHARQQAYLKYDWAVLQWKAERAYEAECLAAHQEVRRYLDARRMDFESMSTAWKTAEQQFRKPVLEIYKHLLQLADAPLPNRIPDVAAALSERLSTHVVDALTHRKAVFLEQQGVQTLISAFSEGTSLIPEQVWHRKELIRRPPFQREPFPLRERLESLFTYRLYVTLRQLSEDMNVHFESLLRRANELRDMVDVNLAMAEASDAADRDSLYHDGLARAAQRLQELTEDYRTRLEAVLDRAEAAMSTEFDLLELCFSSQNFTPLAAEEQRLHRKDQAVGIWNRAVSLWSKGLDEASVRWRHLRSVVLERTLTPRRWLGFASEPEEAPVARSRASDYLNETERRLSSLPLIYRSLFHFDPVSDPRYLKGRDGVLRRLEETHRRWESGVFASVAIVGEAGSGKTSLLDRFLSTSLADATILRIVIPRTMRWETELLDLLKTSFDAPDADDFDALSTRIRSGGPRRVVLEGMQNLFLRHMNGFEAIDRFLLLITETASTVFWMVTCTRYAWNYLDDVIHCSATFTDVVETDAMSANDIREAILSRHRVSGYRAVFIPSDGVKRSRAYRKRLNDEEARQEYLEARYFDDLATWSRGNIKIAMLFWLRTIRGITSDTFTIEPLSADLIEIGDAFGLDDLFAIAAILQHQDLSVDELALTQNRSASDCRMTLTRLHARRILTVSDGRYSLNAVLLRPLTRRLQSKNILH
jgi:hypothetical protein